MIEVQDLTCRVGDFHLGKLSFSVPEGEYFVVLGPTGAGKTLLLECIAGLHPNGPGYERMGERFYERIFDAGPFQAFNSKLAPPAQS